MDDAEADEHAFRQPPDALRALRILAQPFFVGSAAVQAQDRYPFGDKSFDLVVSLGTLHNLKIFELQTAIEEIERVGKNKYIMVESYRNELEQFNMQCWALTAEAFYDTASWIWLYRHFGYTGDYEFIYFE